MAGEWRTRRLGDVIELKRGYDLASGERRDGAIPVVSSSGVSGRHDTAMTKAPGVVTGRYGTIGEVFYIEEDFWPLNTTLYVRDFKGSVPRFVAFALKALDFYAYSDKGAVPGVNRNDLHEARILWPPIPEQRAIADLLGALDDKIALNRRIAQTLEATARALFRSWFVDFDPVRAKADGRETGLDAETAAAFPDAFGEDGPPVGWEKTSLTSVARVLKGTSYKSDDLRASPAALVTLKSFARAGGYKADGLKAFAGPCKSSQVVAPGELIVAATDVTQAAEIVGKPVIVEASEDFRTLVASLDTFIVRPKSAGLEPWILRLFLEGFGFQGFAKQFTSGTTVLHLSDRAFSDFIFPMPPDASLRPIAEKLRAHVMKALAAREQSRTLAALRDTLLPRLISGKLHIADAEKKIEAA